MIDTHCYVTSRYHSPSGFCLQCQTCQPFIKVLEEPEICMPGKSAGWSLFLGKLRDRNHVSNACDWASIDGRFGWHTESLVRKLGKRQTC